MMSAVKGITRDLSALAVLLLIAVLAVNMIFPSGLRSGIVIKKNHDFGCQWYSTWAIGDIELVQTHGDGKEKYLIYVENNGRQDCWEVSQKEFDSVRIGQYIEK